MSPTYQILTDLINSSDPLRHWAIGSYSDVPCPAWTDAVLAWDRARWSALWRFFDQEDVHHPILDEPTSNSGSVSHWIQLISVDQFDGLDKAASVPPVVRSLNKGSQVAVDGAHVHRTVVPQLLPWELVTLLLLVLHGSVHHLRHSNCSLKKLKLSQTCVLLQPANRTCSILLTLVSKLVSWQ